jgi:hypothetical protein
MLATGLVLQGDPSRVAVGSLDGICTAAVDEGGTATGEFISEVPGKQGSPQAATAEHAQQNSSYNNDRLPGEEGRG